MRRPLHRREIDPPDACPTMGSWRVTSTVRFIVAMVLSMSLFGGETADRHAGLSCAPFVAAAEGAIRSWAQRRRRTGRTGMTPRLPSRPGSGFRPSTKPSSRSGCGNALLHVAVDKHLGMSFRPAVVETIAACECARSRSSFQLWPAERFRPYPRSGVACHVPEREATLMATAGICAQAGLKGLLRTNNAPMPQAIGFVCREAHQIDSFSACRSISTLPVACALST